MMWSYLILLALGCGDIPVAAKNGLRDASDSTRSQSVAEVLRTGGAQGIPLVLPLAVKDKSAYVRDSTFTELSKLKTGDAVAALVAKGVKSPDAGVRRVALEVLGFMEAPGVEEALVEPLADKDPKVRAAAAATAGFVKAKSLRDALIKRVETDNDLLTRSYAIEAVSRIGGEDTVAHLDRWVRNANESIQLTALHQFWWHDKERGAARTAEFLADPKLREDGTTRPLLIQAIEEAVKYRAKSTLPELVGLLSHPRARIRDAAYGALSEITGLEIPNSPQDWQDWWKYNGEKYEVPAKPERGAQKPARSMVNFYGIPIVSDRIIFVIDYSGSMNSGGRDGKLKIDSAREALAEVLNALPEKTEFNIIAFSTEPRAWRDTLQAKSKSTVEDALDFARKTQVRGSTNFFDALEQAMNMNEADSIVMLSDGAPSAGAYIFFSRIRHQVRALNRMRKVAVSAIALETTADANRFLSELAKDTGGEFVER